MTSDAFQRLLERAFHTVPAVQANDAIAEMRVREGGGAASVISYEAIASGDSPMTDLAERVLPRLVYFLSCRGVRQQGTADLFVSLFHRERLYFIRSADFLQALGEVQGASWDELLRTYGEP